MRSGAKKRKISSWGGQWAKTHFWDVHQRHHHSILWSSCNHPAVCPAENLNSPVITLTPQFCCRAWKHSLGSCQSQSLDQCHLDGEREVRTKRLSNKSTLISRLQLCLLTAMSLHLQCAHRGAAAAHEQVDGKGFTGWYLEDFKRCR